MVHCSSGYGAGPANIYFSDVLGIARRDAAESWVAGEGSAMSQPSLASWMSCRHRWPTHFAATAQRGSIASAHA